jgi:feruloyl esterase
MAAAMSFISPVAFARPAVSCESLTKVALPNASITSAQSVAAGEFKVPAGDFGASRSGMNIAGQAQLGTNPVFCRVKMSLRPSSDSDIRLEVWLPQSGWNGKFLGVGNFGWGGGLVYSGMLSGLREGYATASNDTGHDSDAPGGKGGRFALGHPEKVIDYAYRANHESTVDAKAIIKAFYGVAASHSYWIGCSLGGLQGLIEAKRYPDDYDGIVVGAPPNPITHFNAAQLYPSWLVSQDSSRFIPKDKYAMVHEAVIKACASPIGLKDGLVDAPDQCKFDPARLQCRGADAANCLTAPQVYQLRQMYAGPSNPRTHEKIFPGPAPGSELELFMFANGSAFGNALDLFRYVAFQNSEWDSTTMDWDKDVVAADVKVGPLMHVDANLKPFFDRGGKLLLYVGWNDFHNPSELASYSEALIRGSGGEPVRRSVRLFTLPGMNHCAGGAGCDTFNKLGAIDAWVDRSQAPDRIVASKVEDDKVVRTRPLCAYPAVARYKGSGDISVADNFVCATK